MCAAASSPQRPTPTPTPPFHPLYFFIGFMFKKFHSGHTRASSLLTRVCWQVSKQSESLTGLLLPPQPGTDKPAAPQHSQWENTAALQCTSTFPHFPVRTNQHQKVHLFYHLPHLPNIKARREPSPSHQNRLVQRYQFIVPRKAANPQDKAPCVHLLTWLGDV